MTTMIPRLRLVVVLALFACGFVTAAKERYPPRRELVKLASSVPVLQRGLKAPEGKGDGPGSPNRPTSSPTRTAVPTLYPTVLPTTAPTANPTEKPTNAPTASPTGFPTTSPTGGPTTSPTEEEEEEDDDEEDDVEEDENETATPTESPTAEPTNAPTTEPTESPTKEEEEDNENDAEENENEDTAEPTSSPTKSPTSDPPADPAAVTTRINMESFVLHLSYQNIVKVEALRADLGNGLKSAVGNVYSSLKQVDLAAEIYTGRRRLQNTASIEFTGEYVFVGNENPNEAYIRSLQWNFLNQFLRAPVPNQDSVNVLKVEYENGDVIYADDASPSGGEASSATGETGGTTEGVNRDVTPPETTSSFSAKGIVVGSLVAGFFVATMGAVYYMRRSNNGTGYQEHRDNVYEMDQEDGSALPTLPGKATLRAAMTPITQASVDSSSPTGSKPPFKVTELEDISPASTAEESVSPQASPTEAIPEDHASLVSGTLTSVIEENSHEVNAETGEDLVAEAGDENFDVSIMADADDEFAAVSSDKQTTTQQDLVVDPQMYSNWVTPLLQLGTSAQDCCFKGATQNVMDTTMPHDLMMGDLELAEQTAAAQNNTEGPIFVANFDKDTAIDEKADSPKKLAPPSAEKEADQEEQNGQGDNAEFVELDSQDTEANAERKNGPLRLYAGKQHGTIFQRAGNNMLASEDSSINLSQQASIMTDDLDLGADLLDKALRDVTLYYPDDEQDSELHHDVSEYMHQIRTENKEYDQNPDEVDQKEVTL